MSSLLVDQILKGAADTSNSPEGQLERRVAQLIKENIPSWIECHKIVVPPAERHLRPLVRAGLLSVVERPRGRAFLVLGGKTYRMRKVPAVLHPVGMKSWHGLLLQGVVVRK